AAMMIQADRYGVSFGQSLRVFSETLRTIRRQAAEEAAAKTTVKVAFPLVLFIFPAMMIMILAPAVLRFLTGSMVGP
ncbi:MAG: type II secretion system F family protein, partial [Nitrospinota bacterium]